MVKISSYNAMNLNGDRQLAVLSTLRSEIIGIQGTCKRSTSDPPHGANRTSGYQIIDFPTTAQDGCSGVQIAIKNIGNIKKFYDPAPAFRGRVGAVLVGSPTHCVCISSLYFRPDPNHPWLAPQQPR